MDFIWLQNTFQAFTKQFFSYRGSLRRHDLCICNVNCSNSQSDPTTKIRQFDWDAISGVKYQTLLSRPFSQGAMWILPGRDQATVWPAVWLFCKLRVLHEAICSCNLQRKFGWKKYIAGFCRILDMCKLLCDLQCDYFCKTSVRVL